jgi:CubicO group peptidase (beta-lactamase class C family)
MLGGQYVSFYGPETRHAFGHIGFINIMGWADPERQISVAFMNSGKPLLYPEIARYSDVMKQIGEAFPKDAGKDWWEGLERAERTRGYRRGTPDGARDAVA